MDTEIEEVILYIEELESEGSVPRNVKLKLSLLSKELKNITKENKSLIINKMLSNLDELSGDVNLDSFTRQQIWSISSMLESIVN